MGVSESKATPCMAISNRKYEGQTQSNHRLHNFQTNPSETSAPLPHPRSPGSSHDLRVNLHFRVLAGWPQTAAEPRELLKHRFFTWFDSPVFYLMWCNGHPQHDRKTPKHYHRFHCGVTALYHPVLGVTRKIVHASNPCYSMSNNYALPYNHINEWCRILIMGSI